MFEESSDEQFDSSSEALRKYKLQERLYVSNNTGLVCKDVVRRVRDYVGNHTYRDVKFTSETGKDFLEPDFVGGVKKLHGGGTVKIQCIGICEYLMKKIGKELANFFDIPFMYNIKSDLFRSFEKQKIRTSSVCLRRYYSGRGIVML